MTKGIITQKTNGKGFGLLFELQRWDAVRL